MQKLTVNAIAVKDGRWSLTWVTVRCPRTCSSLFYRTRTPKITQLSLYSNMARRGTLPKPHFWGRERQLYNLLQNAISWGKRWKSLIQNMQQSLGDLKRLIVKITLRMGANGGGDRHLFFRFIVGQFLRQRRPETCMNTKKSIEAVVFQQLISLARDPKPRIHMT